MVTGIELPEYEPEKYPRTEELMARYDLAARWAEENGLPHREMFRLGCQIVEDSVGTGELNRELAEGKEMAAEPRRDPIQYEAMLNGASYKG